MLAGSPRNLRKGPNSASASSSISIATSDGEDIELREQLERDRIVSMYDKGPDNPHIGIWERSEWEGFKRIDRYGFVQKDTYIIPQDTPCRKVQDVKDAKKERKWLSVVKQTFPASCSHLEDLVWEGIPNKLRIRAWPHLLNINALKKQYRGGKVYAELLARARLISKHVKQIDLDVSRTYRHHCSFRRRYDLKQQSLFNVLVAYSVFNTEIGYCQGMSQIVALLLMFLDEEDAFWCLHALMISPKHSMHGFFITGFPKLQRFEAHFKSLLSYYKPKIQETLEKESIPYFFVTKWWFGCFLDRVPFPLALRIWDIFIFLGDEILIAMALNIMEMHEKTLRGLSLENFMEFVQSGLATDFGFTDDEVMFSLRNLLYRLRRDNNSCPSSPVSRENPIKKFGSVLEEAMMDIHERVHDVRMRHSQVTAARTSRKLLNSSAGDEVLKDLRLRRIFT